MRCTPVWHKQHIKYKIEQNFHLFCTEREDGQLFLPLFSILSKLDLRQSFNKQFQYNILMNFGFSLQKVQKNN